MIDFALTWNEFPLSSLLGIIRTKMTPAVDTRGMQFRLMAIRAPITMAPMAVLALVAQQRYILRGLALGVVKGTSDRSGPRQGSGEQKKRGGRPWPS